MNLKNINKRLLEYLLAASSFLLWVTCADDLDQKPTDPDSFTEKDVFKSASEAKSALAKLYATLALTGQKGATGEADITSIDEGTSQFTRLLFTLNELPTDHAVNSWGDAGLSDFHEMDWTAENNFIEAMYYRLALEISYCNSFIGNTKELGENKKVQEYIAEARFLRAYAYTYLLDFFGNVPLVTTVSNTKPKQSNRKEIFSFVESELIAIQDLLPKSGEKEYGRVDQAASWALLSRIYLNAQTWIGKGRYADCVTYSEKVINSTYHIDNTDVNANGSAYDELFLADNNTNGAQNEFIFTANFDGVQSKTYGGTTYLVSAAVGGSMKASDYGINGGWSGNRTTKALVNKFKDSVTALDDSESPIAWKDFRAMFYADGQNYEIETIANTFTDGYAITKFKNIDSKGNRGKDTDGTFVDTDLPLIRAAEIYLNYAEAVLRNGGGSIGRAVSYINELRERAYGNSDRNITPLDLDLNFILDERARELYWEGFRRTDLIRYGYFTSARYVWPFKGGISSGKEVERYRNLYPIPANVLSINSNLKQNIGY